MKTIVGKVVVLGHQGTIHLAQKLFSFLGVGKTSLCTRYIEKNFSTHVSPTIGASYFTCKTKIEDIIVKLQIWDTAGQERFKAMAPMFYRNANAALLVFDLTRPNTFESMKTWVLELRRNIEEAMVLCVVANKTDLTERKVTRDEALHYAKSIGASYFECSAMSEQGIEQIFRNLSADIIKLCDNEKNARSLKIYEDETESPLMASSTESSPTDVGVTEEPMRSLNSLAHATSVSKCC